MTNSQNKKPIFAIDTYAADTQKKHTYSIFDDGSVEGFEGVTCISNYWQVRQNFIQGSLLQAINNGDVITREYLAELFS